MERRKKLVYKNIANADRLAVGYFSFTLMRICGIVASLASVL